MRSHFSVLIRSSYLIPLATALVLPLVFGLFCPLVFGNADDAVVAYTLSGQMGLPPQPWTDYDWGWHYLLGQSLAKLYTHWPQVAWNGWLLGGWLLVNGLLLMTWMGRLFPRKQAAAYGFLLYAAFLLPLWAHLSFSGVTFVSGLVAGLWWLPLPGDGRKPTRWWPMVLVLLAFAVRWHTTLLGLGLAGMGLLSFPPRRWLRFGMGALLAIALGYLVLWQHRLWCGQQVPGWAADIGIRQALYAFYNLPSRPVSELPVLLPTTSHQQQYQYSFLLDSLRFNTGRLWQLADRLHSQRWWWELRAQRQIEWLFGMHQWLVYLLIFLSATLVVDSDRKGRRMAWALALGSLSLLFVLFTFFKLTHVLLTGIAAAGAFGLMMAKSRYPFRSRRLQIGSAWGLGLGFLLIYLGHFRQLNTAWRHQFQCAVQQMPDKKLVLATTQQFPFMGMPALVAPAYSPLPRLFSPSQAGLALRQHYLRQKSLQQWVLDSHVVLTGRHLDLPDYYHRKQGIWLERKWVTDSTACLPLWTLQPKAAPTASAAVPIAEPAMDNPLPRLHLKP